VGGKSKLLSYELQNLRILPELVVTDLPRGIESGSCNKIEAA